MASLTPIHQRNHLEPFPWYFQPRWVVSGLFLFSLLCFLVLLRAPRVDGQIIGSDGVYYYVYVRSLVIDQDLNFTDEYAYYHIASATARTPSGLPPNKYAIGPAIVWLPFFLVAHGIATIGRVLGLPIIPDGYGYLYQSAVSIGSIIYGTIGFWLAYICTKRFCSQIATLGAIILIWLGSNAFYYMVFEPSMAHMVSLFSVACLLSIWFLQFRQLDPPTLRWGMVLGAAGGLVLLVRLQDGPFLLLPYTSILLRCLAAWRSGNYLHTRRWFELGLLTALFTFIVFTPQLVTWQVLYRSWSVSPYLNDHDPAFYWLQPQIGGVLFSTFHGLFSWHPVYLFAFIGLVFVIRRDRLVGTGLLLLLVLNVYIVAAWWSWWQGDSFGGRMFLNATWIWILGLASLLDQVRSRRWLTGVVVLGLALIVWNVLSLIQYRLGFIPMSKPLTWEQMTVDRLNLPWLILKRFRGG